MPLAERQLTTRVLLKEAVYLLHAHPELNTLPNTPHITIDQDTTATITITITGTTSLTITAEEFDAAVTNWAHIHNVATSPNQHDAQLLLAEEWGLCDALDINTSPDILFHAIAAKNAQKQATEAALDFSLATLYKDELIEQAAKYDTLTEEDLEKLNQLDHTAIHDALYSCLDNYYWDVLDSQLNDLSRDMLIHLLEKETI